MASLRIVEKYELAGVDERERGFNRLVAIHQSGEDFEAWLQYEKTHVTSRQYRTSREALQALVAALHGRGYRQLRSRLTFRGESYLGTREPWVDYPDPTEPWWTGPVRWLRRLVP